MKISELRKHLLRTALGIAGLGTFTACYGMPPGIYDLGQGINGRVIDGAQQPVEGIELSRYGTPLDTTDVEGSFSTIIARWPDREDTIQVHFRDVLPGREGGEFEEKMLVVENHEDIDTTVVVTRK